MMGKTLSAGFWICSFVFTLLKHFLLEQQGRPERKNGAAERGAFFGADREGIEPLCFFNRLERGEGRGEESKRFLPLWIDLHVAPLLCREMERNTAGGNGLFINSVKPHNFLSVERLSVVSFGCGF
jgi:hypothetical protein